MTIKVTFKDGFETPFSEQEVIYKNVVNFEFPKVKTLQINYPNGLANFLFTKAIKRIEVIEF